MGQTTEGLVIRTLGGLTVELNGVPLSGPASQRKHLALFALLASAGDRGMSRDRLLAYLWPERDAESAHHFLSQACYALRRQVGAPDLFLGTADQLRLSPTIITSDLQCFRKAVERGDLATAASVYAGPFLDGFYLPGADEFERWAEAERSRLVRRSAAVLRELADLAASRGDHRAAAEWWRQLVVIDPFSVEAVLGLMTALAAVGEQAQAVFQGLAHSQRVREELGAVPAQAITDLVDNLRQQQIGPPLGNER